MVSSDVMPVSRPIVEPTVVEFSVIEPARNTSGVVSFVGHVCVREVSAVVDS